MSTAESEKVRTSEDLTWGAVGIILVPLVVIAWLVYIADHIDGRTIYPFEWPALIGMSLFAVAGWWGGRVTWTPSTLSYRWAPGSKKNGSVNLERLTEIRDEGRQAVEVTLIDGLGGRVIIPFWPRLGRFLDTTDPQRMIWRTQTVWGPEILAAADRNHVEVPPAVRHLLTGKGYWTYYDEQRRLKRKAD